MLFGILSSILAILLSCLYLLQFFIVFRFLLLDILVVFFMLLLLTAVLVRTFSHEPATPTRNGDKDVKEGRRKRKEAEERRKEERRENSDVISILSGGWKDCGSVPRT